MAKIIGLEKPNPELSIEEKAKYISQNYLDEFKDTKTYLNNFTLKEKDNKWWCFTSFERDYPEGLFEDKPEYIYFFECPDIKEKIEWTDIHNDLKCKEICKAIINEAYDKEIETYFDAKEIEKENELALKFKVSKINDELPIELENNINLNSLDYEYNSHTNRNDYTLSFSKQNEEFTYCLDTSEAKQLTEAINNKPIQEVVSDIVNNIDEDFLVAYFKEKENFMEV